MANIIESIENSTRPNVIIHIDLPTYYMPVTENVTQENVHNSTTRSWSNLIFNYLSNITLLELAKFGLTKCEASINLTDGVDMVVNASKVFSNFGSTRFAKTRILEATKARYVRRGKQFLTSDLSIEYSYISLNCHSFRPL